MAVSLPVEPCRLTPAPRLPQLWGASCRTCSGRWSQRTGTASPRTLPLCATSSNPKCEGAGLQSLGRPSLRCGGGKRLLHVRVQCGVAKWHGGAGAQNSTPDFVRRHCNQCCTRELTAKKQLGLAPPRSGAAPCHPGVPTSSGALRASAIALLSRCRTHPWQRLPLRPCTPLPQVLSHHLASGIRWHGSVPR